jgi:5'-phosphate synthase pdxT subunit
VKVGVLALQGDVREHAQILAELGADPIEVRRPEHLAAVDALVLPGGESTTMNRLLVTSELRQPVAERLASGMPAFGTCAGMILLASAILDGRPDQVPLSAIDIDVRRNAFGRQVDSFETDLDITGVGGGAVHAIFIRAPIVDRVGADVEVLAGVDGRPVVCRQGNVLVAAFHPEIAGEPRLHELFLERA